MKTIKTECSDCGGTGLYSGFCEGEGHAVVCLACGGSGCRKIHYKPYTGRKRKRGIVSIRWSQGRFIMTGVGGEGDSMTYREFQKQVPQAEI
jgi:hypothetical protein